MVKRFRERDGDMTYQYQEFGGGYVRCGETKKTLNGGFYDVVDTARGTCLREKNSIVGDELIDIPGTVADEIFSDIDLFLSSLKRYTSYGLTHKRGYLLYGPPGSGKTSLAIMIGRKFVEQANGIVVYIGCPADLAGAVGILRDVEEGRPSMYLLEEADKFVNSTTCLSILDGEYSIQSSVFVAMTNYKEDLPPRIANRPGRFDRVVKVDCPPRGVQLEYLRRIEARVNDGPTVSDSIVAALDGLPVSLAHLREAFIAHVMMNIPLSLVRARFDEMCADRKPEQLTDYSQGTAYARHPFDDLEPYDDSDDLSEKLNGTLNGERLDGKETPAPLG